MSDTKNSGDKTISVPSKTLSLKRPVEQGVVRQSFSHGRTKAVVVEKVKRRVIGPGSETKPEPVPAPAAPQVSAARRAPAAPTASAAPQRPAPAAPTQTPSGRAMPPAWQGRPATPTSSRAPPVSCCAR
jgi:translation initiation factor IF-2